MFKPKKLIDENKLLDNYIAEHFAFPGYEFSENDRKAIANTVGFQKYQLAVAWNAFLGEMAKQFPFNLFKK